MSVQCVYAGGFGMWPGEEATSWCGDAVSDCLAFPVPFRKYQSPPTQFLRSPFDANVPPVACRIWGMLFENCCPCTQAGLLCPSPRPAPQEFRHILTEKDTLVMSAAHRWHHMTPVCVMELRTSQPKALAVLIAFAFVNSKVTWCGTNKPTNKKTKLWGFCLSMGNADCL